MSRRRDHRPRFDTSICPDPDRCTHTTDVEGECCECCGRVNEASREYPTEWAATTHRMTSSDYRGVVERRLNETRGEAKRCEHRHRTRAAANRCASTMLAARRAEHVDVCKINRGGVCNCVAGVPASRMRRGTTTSSSPREVA